MEDASSEGGEGGGFDDTNIEDIRAVREDGPDSKERQTNSLKRKNKGNRQLSKRNSAKLKLLSSDLIKVYNHIAKTLVRYETLWHRSWVDSVQGFQQQLHRPLFVCTTEDFDDGLGGHTLLRMVAKEYLMKQEDQINHGASLRNVKTKNQGKNDENYSSSYPLPHALRVNFDPAIFQLTQEARHISRLGYSIPEAARFVCEQERRLKRIHDELKYLLGELAEGIEKIPDTVRPLLVPLLNKIDAALRPGLGMSAGALSQESTINTALTWMSLQVPGFIARTEILVRDLKTRVAKTRDVLDHQIEPGIAFIQTKGGTELLALPQGIKVKNIGVSQMSVAAFLEHIEARCFVVAKQIEEKSSSVESAVEHMIGRACEGYTAEDVMAVDAAAEALRSHYELLIQNAIERVIISALRAMRLRVASGVGGTFLFLDPPLFGLSLS